MKKVTKIKWLMALLLGTVLATACARTEQEGQNTAVESKKESLVLWSYFETNAQKQGLDRLVRDFNQSQNEYELSWEYIPMTGFTKSLSSAYTENSLPDLAILDNPDMPLLIQLGMFEDITEQVKAWGIPEKFYPSIVETTCYEGRYYGVPFNCNNTALIYNKELFSRKGIEPPATWEELRSVAKALTAEEQKGFLMCGIEGEQGAFQMLSWILAAGEDPEDSFCTPTEEAFAFIQSLISDRSMSENFINLTQTDVAREFVDGKAAMMQNGPWVFPMLEEAGIDYGIVPLPSKSGKSAVVGGENIGILKGKNLEGALAFIKFCMESDALIQFCYDANVLPGNMEQARKMVKEAEKLQVFEAQMETAVTRTSFTRWSSVSQLLTEGVFQIISGEKSPEEIARMVWN